MSLHFAVRSLNFAHTYLLLLNELFYSFGLTATISFEKIMMVRYHIFSHEGLVD